MGVEKVSLVLDEPKHAPDFVRLNELCRAHFCLEAPDLAVAPAHSGWCARGGHILSLVKEGRVIGVCALLKERDAHQLARMAVDSGERRQGYGAMLLRAALEKAREHGASRVYLLSNTKLAPAIAMYRKHGFVELSEGAHPNHARCNIVMELPLT